MRDAIDFQDICTKLRPIFGSKIDDLFLEYSMADTMERKREVYSMVLALYSRFVDDKVLEGNVILKSPEHGTVAGEYPLAVISYPNKADQVFGLREKDWIRHMCITGMSGSGKTTFAMRIANNFIQKNKPFIVFDWKKSFRQLLQLSKGIIIFTVGKPKASNFFKLNVCRPPEGVSADEWITTLADLLCECYGASYGVHKILSEVMQDAYREFGVYEGSDNYPTWFQIRDRLNDMEGRLGKHSRESEWLSSCLRIAHSLTFGEFGQTINDKNRMNMKVEELLSSQVVFELDSLGTMEKKFFCSFVLLYIYKQKKASSTSLKNPFQAAIVVDEAHNIFLRQKVSFIHETITDTIYRELREYGIALICLDQHASKLSETVVGNSATNIAFQQMLPQDVDVISKLMFLHDEKSIYTRLDVGQAVVKLSERFHDPFKISVIPLSLSQDLIDDTHLREMVKKHCQMEKRLKLCHEEMESEKLALGLGKIRKAFIASGTAFTDAELANHLNPKDEERPLINHLQQQIVDDIPQALGALGTVRKAKKKYLDEGFRHDDINAAFTHYSQTREGKEFLAFLDHWNSYSQTTNIQPRQAYTFLRTLHKFGTMPTTKLYEQLNCSIRKSNDVKNVLEEFDLVVVREEKNCKGMIKKIGFTRNGSSLMEKLGIV